VISSTLRALWMTPTVSFGVTPNHKSGDTDSGRA
jgi:hypothetical protein